MASDGMDEEVLTREEAKRILRRLELEAYSSVITAFRAQGDLSREKKQALADLAVHLSISTERHRAEVRRVVNDDSLNSVAECMHGIGTATEWSIEGRRLVSLTPRLVPQTVFTAKATHTANAISHENSKLPAKKTAPQSTRERSVSLSSKVSERFEEKLKVKDSKLVEFSRSLSTSSSSSIKSQESEKAKKKKKPNPPSNKVLKPSKLNLPTKSEYKGASSPNLTKQNLLSPTSLHKPVSPGGSHGSTHQKPLILQRSPQKSSQISRSLSTDGLGSSSSPYITKAVLQSPTSTGTFSGANDVGFKQQRSIIDARTVSPTHQAKVSQILVSSSSNSTAIQKMKFKTPIAKSKAKPAKIKPITGVQCPSGFGANNVSPSAESLNLLATSTVVPMAPISPVKPVMPSCSGLSGVLPNLAIVTSTLSSGSLASCSASSLSSGSCPVKVVQVQKSTNSTASHSSPANTGSKPFVVVSSSTSSKPGSAQRVLALSNVPISGSQQLKIASIPNVLQQSGAKIVSIAKSMPMTTGFKMIAVTTVVPGSTQVKTVYIATPIMSVTKTSTPSVQCTASNNPVTTKLLQTLASSPGSLVRPAETDVSPSNLGTGVKPSLGIINSRGFAPASSTAVNSSATTTVTTLTAMSSKTPTSLATSLSTSIAVSKQNGPSKSSNSIVVPKLGGEILTVTDKMPSKSNTSPTIEIDSIPKAVESHSALKNVDSSEKIVPVNESKTSIVESNLKANDKEKQTGNSRGLSSTFETTVENTDETILLAGERFLADLAAKFSKNDVDVPKSSSGAVDGLDDLTAPEINDTEKNVPDSIVHIDAQDQKFSTRIQVQHCEPQPSSLMESKVIVRKIGEEYSSPINLCNDHGSEKSDTGIPNQKQTSRVGPSLCALDRSGDCSKTAFAEISPSRNGKPRQPSSSSLCDNKTSFGRPGLLNNDISQSVIEDTDSIEGDSSLSELVVKDTPEHGVNFLSDVTEKVHSMQTQVLESERIVDVSREDSPRNVYVAFTPANGGMEANMQQETEKRVSPSVSSHVGSPSHEVSIRQVSDKKSPSNMGASSGLKVVTRKSPLSFGGPSRDQQISLPNTSKRALFVDVENFSSALKERNSPSKHLVDNFTSTSNQGYSSSKNLHIGTNVGHINSISPSSGYKSPLNSPTQKIPQSPVDKGMHDKCPIASLSGINRNASPELREQTLNNDIKTNYGDALFTSIVPTAGTGSYFQNSFDHNSAKTEQKTVKSRNKTPGTEFLTPVGPLQQTTSLPNEVLHKQGNDVMKSHVTNNIPRGSSKKRKSDSSPVITVGWIKGALALLQKVSRFRGPNKQRGEMNAASWFTRPVSPAEAPGYYKVIKKPMDFSTVKKKLEDGVYKDFTEFYSDMVLIKTNCHTYNPVDHLVRKDCDLVFAFFEEECCKFLEKQQKPEESPSKKTKLDVSA